MAAKSSGRGYEINFVDKPPRQLEISCPICLDVLLDPKLATCCHHSFCARCIGNWAKEGKPCPLCKKQLTLVDDKKTERMLNVCKVYCPNKDKGCGWTGELGDHLNHCNGCQFQEVQCGFCQSYQCERWLMPHHISKECLDRDVECEYHYAGCAFKNPRCELQAHIKDCVDVHLSLVATYMKNGLSHKEREIEQLRDELRQQREENAAQVQELKQELDELSQSTQLEQLRDQLQQQRDENVVQVQELKQQLDEVSHATQQQCRELQKLKRHRFVHWIPMILVFLVVLSIDAYLYQLTQSSDTFDINFKKDTCSSRISIETENKEAKKQMEVIQKATCVIEVEDLRKQVDDLQNTLRIFNGIIEGKFDDVRSLVDGIVQNTSKILMKHEDLEKQVDALQDTQGKFDSVRSQVDAIMHNTSRILIKHEVLTKWMDAPQDTLGKFDDVKSQVDIIMHNTSRMSIKHEDLKKHVDALQHTSKMSSQMIDEKFEEIQKQIMEIWKDNSKVLSQMINGKFEEMRKQMAETTEESMSYYVERKEFQRMRREIQLLGEQVDFPVLPVYLKLMHMTQHKVHGILWLSMPFYTHQEGYKLRLVVYPKGIKKGSKAHISVSVHLMSGRHDDHLDWPLNVTLTVTLLHTNNTDYISKTFELSSQRYDNDVIGRVWNGIMARNGVLWAKFARRDHFDLYTKFDTLHFRIDIFKAGDPKSWHKLW